MNQTDAELLRQVADMDGTPEGAYNIRKDGALDSRRSTDTIEISRKDDKPSTSASRRARRARTYTSPSCSPRAA